MLVLLFFASGALALVYQVLWQRQFALLFGSSSAATAAVLAAFFAGLGLGSACLGRIAARWQRPLQVYAVLEALIGLSALLITPALSGFGEAYPSLARPFANHPTAFLALKAGLSFLALAIPTFCMGGTLPVLAQFLDHGPRRLGLSVGGFYVANTAGAAIGSLAMPFLLLPALGAQGTLLLGAAANACVALVAWRIDRQQQLPSPTPSASRAHNPSVGDGKRRSVNPKGQLRNSAIAPTSRVSEKAPPRFSSLAMLSAVSGGVTFSLQVLWNRAFAQIHENSLHAFAIIATVFILALAVGGQLARVALQRGRSAERILGVAWLAGGATTMLAPWAFVTWTQQLAFLPASDGWLGEAWPLLRLSAAVIFVPVLLLGLGFPALMESAGRIEQATAASLIGRLLGINIAGCVVGALLAGFVLPSLLGLWGSLVLTGALAAGAGACFAFPSHGAGPRPIGTTWMPLSAFALCSVLAWIGANYLPRVRLASEQKERLIALTEGPHGIVAVTERPGSRRLKLNNHYALGGTLSLGDQRMQAHLPMLLHPAPKRVGHLGLGTGLSAGGVLFHPVSDLEVVELVPEVVQAARVHFAEGSPGLFSDARVRIRTEDARNYLRARPEPFDVLIGDLVVPWRQGESALFTLEHFQAARAALKPGGLFCQWLPMFQLSEVETRILMRTFLRVFPQASVWRGDFSPDRPALALIGSADSWDPNPQTIRTRLAEMKPDPVNPQLVDPVGFWMNFIGRLEPDDIDAAEQRLHTENQPWMELLGPRTHTRNGRSTLFTGRTLQAWLANIRDRSKTRLPQLTSAEWEAAASGDLLYEFSLSLLERREREATRLRSELERRLPPPVVRAIFGG